MNLEQLTQERAALSKQVRQLRMLAANVTSNTDVDHASNEIKAFLNALNACEPAVSWLTELLENHPEADPQIVDGRPRRRAPTESLDAATAYHYRLITAAVEGSDSLIKIMYFANNWSPNLRELVSDFNRLHFSRFWRALGDVLSDHLNALQGRIEAATPRQPVAVQQHVHGSFHGIMAGGDVNHSTATINNTFDLADKLAALKQGLSDLSEADAAATGAAIDALVEVANGKQEASNLEVAQHLDTVINAGSGFSEGLRQIMLGAAGSLAAHGIVQAYYFLVRAGGLGM